MTYVWLPVWIFWVNCDTVKYIAITRKDIANALPILLLYMKHFHWIFLGTHLLIPVLVVQTRGWFIDIPEYPNNSNTIFLTTFSHLSTEYLINSKIKTQYEKRICWLDWTTIDWMALTLISCIIKCIYNGERIEKEEILVWVLGCLMLSFTLCYIFYSKERLRKKQKLQLEQIRR